ncbi:MAG: 2-C-methyl-D-erythritol 4-phosphate cytidylyltransferase [Clostridia bacterium]|nr:2-C-methyl-D-erythritol 4-phosphate cytidylyltransferase [Clostridia bacterium]
MSVPFTPVNLSLPTVGVLICAAGKGERAGFSKNKLLVPLNGEIPLEKTLKAFDYHKVSQIVVTSSKEDQAEIQKIADNFARVSVVLGGDTRSKSVYNGLKAIQTDIVLIHDGARPFVSREVIDGCIDCVKKNGSGVCALPSTDSVAIVNGQGELSKRLQRNEVYRLQTPQGFFTEEIFTAYEKAFESGKTDYTDDSSLYFDYVKPPYVCAGSRANIKLTYASDFEVATRVGFGVDTHAFGKAQDYITLCGVKVPSESGLIAHSDGDVALHALMDALLSAAGLRDIGYYFPDTDEQYKGADSTLLLKKVVALINEQGFKAKNVSIAIQAEKPRLSKYVDSMKERVSSLLELPVNAVGITVGTNEKLGYVGEGKGITVYAYVLLS